MWAIRNGQYVFLFSSKKRYVYASCENKSFRELRRLSRHPKLAAIKKARGFMSGADIVLKKIDDRIFRVIEDKTGNLR